MKSGVVLKLSSAIALDGEVFNRGSLVEVSQAEAANFIARGKASLATDEDRSKKPQSNIVKESGVKDAGK